MRLVPKGNNKDKGRVREAFLCAESLVRAILLPRLRDLGSMKREGGAQLQDAGV